MALLQGHRKSLPGVHFPSSDCSASTPKDYTRIFIAYRNDNVPGAGTASDPFDGSSAQKFDVVLRTRSESGVIHLVVCIGPGTFQTEGAHDHLLGRGHFDSAQPAGFTVNQGWRIHGAGADQTVLQLTDLYLDSSSGKYLPGLILGTYDLGSYGIEVSDLTLDDKGSGEHTRPMEAAHGNQAGRECDDREPAQHWLHVNPQQSASGKARFLMKHKYKIAGGAQH